MHSLELTPQLRTAFDAVTDALSTVLGDDAQGLLIADEPLPNGWRFYFTADGMGDKAPEIRVNVVNDGGVTVWCMLDGRPAFISRGVVNSFGDYIQRTPDEDVRDAVLPLVSDDLISR